MRKCPMITTERLFLRPFFNHEAKEVHRLGGDAAVADMLFTLNLCTTGVAQQWIRNQQQHAESGAWVNLAITDLAESRLMGSVGLDIDQLNSNAEIIYWLGKEFWGQGYATEAAAAVVRYGFETLRLYRIYARYLARNRASGRVLEKLGMTHEGVLRGHLKKRGVFEDLNVMGIMKDAFMKGKRL